MKTKEINKAFCAISGVFYCKNTNWAERLFDQCRAEEKSHRGFGHDFNKYHPNAVSIADCARLFAVHRIAEYLTGAKFPTGQDYLHTQTSCFIAAGMVDEFGDELREALAGFDLAELAQLDYVQFVGKAGEMAIA